MTRTRAVAAGPPATTAPAPADTRSHLQARASNGDLHCRAPRGHAPRAWTRAAASQLCAAPRRERGTETRRRRKGRRPRQEYRSAAAQASGSGRGAV